MWRTAPLCTSLGHEDLWIKRDTHFRDPLWSADLAALRRKLLKRVMEYEHAVCHRLAEAMQQAIAQEIYELCDVLHPSAEGGETQSLAEPLAALNIHDICPQAYEFLTKGSSGNIAPSASTGPLARLAGASHAIRVCHSIKDAIVDGKSRYLVHHIAVLYTALGKLQGVDGVQSYIDGLKNSFQAVKDEEARNRELSEGTVDWIGTFADSVLQLLEYPGTYAATVYPTAQYLKAG